MNQESEFSYLWNQMFSIVGRTQPGTPVTPEYMHDKWTKIMMFWEIHTPRNDFMGNFELMSKHMFCRKAVETIQRDIYMQGAMMNVESLDDYIQYRVVKSLDNKDIDFDLTLRNVRRFINDNLFHISYDDFVRRMREGELWEEGEVEEGQNKKAKKKKKKKKKKNGKK